MTTNESDVIPEHVRAAAMTNLLPCVCDEPYGLRNPTIEHVCRSCKFIIPMGGQLWAQEAFPNFRVHLSLAGPVGVAHGTHLMMITDPREHGSMASVHERGYWLWPPHELALHLHDHRFTFQGYTADIIRAGRA